MAITAAERKLVPEADWGDWRGSTSLSAYPIRNQADLDSAALLIGKAAPGVKSKIIAIAMRKKLTLPAAWQDAKMTADFSLSDPVGFDDGMVVRRGKIFETGSYPDKQFAMTAEELAAAAAAFTPCSLDLEHQSTVLDNNLGELRSVEVSPDGSTLYGTVALPTWLDGLLEGTGRKVSATWNRVTKRLEGLALVNNPRIADAALLSAFAAASPHTTREGQSTVQMVHDLTAKSGAVCSPANPNGTQHHSSSYFVSSGEAKTLQALHDAACTGGAKCSAMQDTSTYAAAFAALFAGNRHNKADMADIQSIHDLAAKQGASCTAEPAVMSGTAPAVATKGRTTMANKFGSWFGLGRDARDMARDAGAELPPEEHFSVVADEVQDAREAAHKEELARFAATQAEAANALKAAQDALFAATAQRLQGEAAAFADGLIVGNKLLPAEREGLIAALTTAGMDDAASGPVTFSNGTQGSRVEQLKAMYSARPAHGLTKEQMAANAPFTSIAGGKAPDTSPDSYDDAKLLSMTPAGRQALGRKKA